MKFDYISFFYVSFIFKLIWLISRSSKILINAKFTIELVESILDYEI
jgi:hypothetical protein